MIAYCKQTKQKFIEVEFRLIEQNIRPIFFFTKETIEIRRIARTPHKSRNKKKIKLSERKKARKLLAVSI